MKKTKLILVILSLLIVSVICESLGIATMSKAQADEGYHVVYVAGKKVAVTRPVTEETNRVIIYFGGDGEKTNLKGNHSVFVNGTITAEEANAIIYTVAYVDYEHAETLYKNLLYQICKDFSNNQKHLDSRSIEEVLIQIEIIVTGFSNGGDHAYAFYRYLQENGASNLRCGLIDGTGYRTAKKFQKVSNDYIDENLYIFVGGGKYQNAKGKLDKNDFMISSCRVEKENVSTRSRIVGLHAGVCLMAKEELHRSILLSDSRMTRAIKAFLIGEPIDSAEFPYLKMVK